MTKYEYRTAVTQQGRVTHVDSVWIGARSPTDQNAIDDCPDLHVYLNHAGDEGWELCGVVPMANGQASHLVLKRHPS